MMSAIRSRLSHAREDNGISMVELLVVMMLSALVLTLTGVLYVGVAKATMNTVDTRQSTAESSNVMNAISTDIRSATRIFKTDGTTQQALLEAKPAQLTVITYTDAGPTFASPYQMRFRVSGGNVLEDRWNPSATYPVTGTPNVTRVLGGEILNTTQIFRYYTAEGTELVAPAAGLSASDRDRIVAIEVTVQLRARNTSTSVTLINNVGMPNTGVERTDD